MHNHSLRSGIEAYVLKVQPSEEFYGVSSIEVPEIVVHFAVS